MRSFSECEPVSSLSVYVLQHLQPVAQTTKTNAKKKSSCKHLTNRKQEAAPAESLNVLWPLPT